MTNAPMSDGRILLYGQAALCAAAVMVLNWSLATACPDVHIDSGVAGVFFAVIGIVYAILIGFAIYMVSTDFNELRRSTWSEVSQLQNAWDYLSFLDNQHDVVLGIKSALQSYLDSIVANEWPAMSKLTDTDTNTPESLKSVMRAVNAIRVTNPSDSVALEKIMECIASADRLRVDRLVASRYRLPALVYHLVVILSLIIVSVFSFLAIDAVGVNLALNGVNGFAIALVCLIIRDLDNPFRGAWKIEPIPFVRLQEHWAKPTS